MAKVSLKPLFLLDEIIKMSSDMRGDPARTAGDAGSERTWRSTIIARKWITISQRCDVCRRFNSMNIPAPLLDRMEVIVCPVIPKMKLNIAKRHLLPKQIRRNAR